MQCRDWKNSLPPVQFKNYKHVNHREKLNVDVHDFKIVFKLSAVYLVKKKKKKKEEMSVYVIMHTHL